MTYTTEQISRICGLSKRTVQRCVGKMLLSDAGKDMVVQSTNDKGHILYLVTEAGFEYFRLKYGFDSVKEESENERSFDERSAGSVAGGPEPQSQIVAIANIENQYIEMLKEQIKEKDIQIQKLLEQNSNLQAILQTYQIKMLPSPKIPWYKRIFGSRKDFD